MEKNTYTGYELNITAQGCCDECGDIVHNHIDCPSCGTIFADTGSFHDLYEEYQDLQDKSSDCITRRLVITCEACGGCYTLLAGEPYDDDSIWEFSDVYEDVAASYAQAEAAQAEAAVKQEQPIEVVIFSDPDFTQWAKKVGLTTFLKPIKLEETEDAGS